MIHRTNQLFLGNNRNINLRAAFLQHLVHYARTRIAIPFFSFTSERYAFRKVKLK